jgi:hypothetical protein
VSVVSTKRNDLERIVQVGPAWDRRDPDPSKDYGIGAMSLRFILKGPRGAVQFIFYTAQYTRPVAERMWNGNRSYNPFKGMGADIGYHAYTPQYEGHTAMGGKCDILGCECYYDGSSLRANEFADEFIEGGDKVVWPMLEKEYEARFGA